MANENSKMKVGAYVRSILIQMFQNNEISSHEIEMMQTADYSKQIFDLQYPLLLKVDSAHPIRPDRYWAGTVKAFGSYYLLCSEWYETKANNDRYYFDRWHADRGRWSK